MKKNISVIALVCAITIILTSCSTLLDMVGSMTDPNKQKYKTSLKLIEEKKYEEAYEILSSLKGYAPAEAELENFYLIPIKYVQKSKTNSNSQITYEAEYNDKDLVTKIIKNSPSESITNSFSYDSNGNVTRYTRELTIGSNNRLIVTENTFDTGNKLIESVTTFPSGGTETEEYEYDSNGNVTKISLTSTSNGTSFTEYAYDAAGNVIKEVITSFFGYKTTTERTYDSDGRLAKEIVIYQQTNQERTIEYSYNADGKLAEERYSSITTAGPYAGDGVNYKITYSYDESGNLTKISHIYDVNTIDALYTYNDASQPEKIEVLYSYGTSNTYEFEYNKYGAISRMNTTLDFDVEIEWKLAYYTNGIPKNIVELIDTVSYYFYDLKVQPYTR